MMEGTQRQEGLAPGWCKPEPLSQGWLWLFVSRPSALAGERAGCRLLGRQPPDLVRLRPVNAGSELGRAEFDQPATGR